MLQGDLAYTEKMGAHRAVTAYRGSTPAVDGAFVAPSASVIGDVTMGDGSSVWYGAVLRGDVNKITVGSNSHIGDRSVVHVASQAGSLTDKPLSTHIGEGSYVGPLSVVHACTVGNRVTIGGCSKILDGATIGDGAVIEAGSLVSPGATVPAGQLWGGVPAKFIRNVTDQEAAANTSTLEETSALALSLIHISEPTRPY
eukprot:TRINITY_DN3859_c0_g2_i1.p1 TRINITY_DN3859_c0_g2~~TRINITY_DN3859_c0_g2_i1.p1  ORF type:complete len:199 (+),score=41.80 TRINITY_DN3859_c0_g2_i1:3-599(+)